MRLHSMLAGAALALFGLLPASAQNVVAPYVPTPAAMVEAMLKLASVGSNDYVIDLGSGDGRIVIAAAKQFGARGFGVDINADLVRGANESAARGGVADRARFYQRDLYQTDLREATVVTLYLLPAMLEKLEPKLLAELSPETRIISHDYPLSWQHKQMQLYDIDEKVLVTGVTRTILYLYVVPAKVAGIWQLDLPRKLARRPAKLSLTQNPLRSGGQIEMDGKTVPLTRVSVNGTEVSFSFPEHERPGRYFLFSGTAAGDSMRGTVKLAGESATWRARKTGN